MEFSNKTYFAKLLGISNEYGGIEASFKDQLLESQFKQANLIKHVRKVSHFNFFFFVFFLLGLYPTVKNNKGLITGSYFLIAGILIDLGLAKISCYFYTNYRMFKIIKIIRFFLMYFNISLNWILYAGEESNEVNVIRVSYNFLLIMNCIYIFFIDFNYILLAIIPLLNTGVLYSIQRTRNLVYHQMLPEIIVNILYYYATFLLKKSEYLYEKQLFLESKNNENYTEYTNNLINNLNTFIISIHNDNILFINHSANKFFNQKYLNKDWVINKSDAEKSNENYDLSSSPCNKNYKINTEINSFFTKLVLEKSAHPDLKYGTNFKDIINLIYSNSKMKKIELIKLGTFYEKENNLNFEICVRKLKYSEEALEILLYDITDIKMAEKISIEAKFKQKIFAKIAHEFKTPLLTIISMIDKINEFQLNDTEINKNITKNLGNISNLSNYTLSLITDIVHYVSGCVNAKLNLKEISLTETLNFSFNVLKTLIECNESKKERIKPILEIDGNIDQVKIVTDENRLKQIILNFISNSYKFTLCGFIKLKVKLMDRRKYVEVSVKDSGIGIKNEDHKQIFIDYANISLGEDNNLYGSGLGLSITKGLAKSLNYKIGFKSEFGRGSKFFIRINCIDNTRKRKTSNSQVNLMSLPLFIKDNFDEIRSYKQITTNYLMENESKNDGIQVDLGPNVFYLETEMVKYDLVKTEEMYLLDENSINIHEDFNFYKIVIVDDNKLVRDSTVSTIKTVLSEKEMTKYEFIVCYDGIDLLALIKDDYQGMIKLIFVDENMNYLNGSDTIKIIRRLEKDKKINSYRIVSISAISDEETTSNFLNLGFDYILPKPCKKNDLRKVLNIFLNC
jgi:signal transduction histidine kinase